MNKILLAIGMALAAIGDAIIDTIENGAGVAQLPTAAGDAAAAPAARRGRPPKSDPAPAAASPAPAGAAPAAAATADVEKERTRIRGMYQPLIEGGRGEEVRVLITKYSPTGMGTMKPENFAAFEKDVQALLM